MYLYEDFHLELEVKRRKDENTEVPGLLIRPKEVLFL